MEPFLSDLQMSCLRVLWKRGEARVTEVHDALSRTRSIAPTTVATVLQRLERRGAVRHRTEGRQFVYSAAISEDDVTSSLLRRVVRRFFKGDVSALVHGLLSAKSVKAGDLARVKEMIAAYERERRDRS